MYPCPAAPRVLPSDLSNSLDSGPREKWVHRSRGLRVVIRQLSIYQPVVPAQNSMNEVDRLNSLFISHRASDVIQFLDQFETRGSLIDWLKFRPATEPTIHEVDGETDVTVVIPTSNFEGPLAVNSREHVFKGLHIVFVESRKPVDAYFNIGHNVNAGVTRARRYSPRWIVYAGDDMIGVDAPAVLSQALAKCDPSEFDSVFVLPEGRYHSLMANLGRQNVLRSVAFSLTPARRAILRLEQKFGVTLFDSRASGAKRIFFSKGYQHWSIASMGIVSSSFLSRTGGRMFDETFANDGLDIELSLRLTRDREKYTFVNFRIDEHVGATMGLDDARRLRMVANYAYLQDLLERRPEDYFPDSSGAANFLLGSQLKH